VNKEIKQAQEGAGVPHQKVFALVPTATTRWGNQFLQLERNCLLRPAIDPTVEKFKRENRHNKEAIVEPNESDQGSKAGKPVAAVELGIDPAAWEESAELEAFLSYPYDIKETIEHHGTCTGAQALMLLHDLKENFCAEERVLETKQLPTTPRLADRARVTETKKHLDISYGIVLARRLLKSELHERCFINRASNGRLVQCYMSKQMDAKVFLTPQQFELSKTLYMQWLRDASNLIKLPTRESPRKKVKVEQSKVEQGRALFRGATTQAAEAARHQAGDSFDAMQDEIERWERLAADEIDKYRAVNGLLNEFKMAWDLRDRFPLHFIVFKQTAVHLPHEANVEQIFSRAGGLTDPNIDQDYLATLVVVGCNKSAFKPSCDAIKAKYYQLFRGKGGEGLEEDKEEADEAGGGSS
jgi:hypothetical protein